MLVVPEGVEEVEVVDIAEGTAVGLTTGPFSSLAVPASLPSDTSPLTSASACFSLEAERQPKMALAADIVGETCLPLPEQ